MNSMERVLCTLGHREPDRVPLFLLFSMYGAKEAGLSVGEYFSRPELVVKTQLYMKEKYGSDCFYTFPYAAAEIEAWGGEVLFVPEGPPNTGEPLLKDLREIDSLEVPDLERTPALMRVLEVTRGLFQEGKGETPIIGVVMSPFSLPVMQLGFEAYLKLIYFDKVRFQRLMMINRQFTLAWADAQLKAGATAICYFNPLASTDILEKSLYLTTGYPVDREITAAVKGPLATHLASGRVLPVMEEVISTGSALIGIGSGEDPAILKEAARGRITLLGNLNGVEMVGWSEETAAAKVRALLGKAASGGGFILSDSHGEIPWQVPEKVLLSISRTVREWDGVSEKKG
jgi:uroporphyrinogen decarboxylase